MNFEKNILQQEKRKTKSSKKTGRGQCVPCMGLRGLRAQHGVRGLASLLTAAVNIFQTIGKKGATAAQRELANTMMLLSEGFYGSGANKAPRPGMPSWGWHDLARFQRCLRQATLLTHALGDKLDSWGLNTERLHIMSSWDCASTDWHTPSDFRHPKLVL